MTNIVTKNGAVIVTDGKAAERCECCNDCPCNTVLALQVQFDWWPQNYAGLAAYACGKGREDVFEHIPMSRVFTLLPRQAPFSLAGCGGEGVVPKDPGHCFFYYHDPEITGSSAGQFGTLANCLELWCNMSQLDNNPGVYVAGLYAYVYDTIVSCETSNWPSPFSHGFHFGNWTVPAACGPFAGTVNRGTHNAFSYGYGPGDWQVGFTMTSVV